MTANGVYQFGKKASETKVGKAALLLVDDDPDLLRLLAIRLKANGYDVTAVDNGQQRNACGQEKW